MWITHYIFVLLFLFQGTLAAEGDIAFFKFAFKCACVAGEGGAGEPKIEVSWDGGSFASKSIGANGEWNEIMSLTESTDREHQYITIELWDWDSGSNDLMGSLELTQAELLSLTPEKWTEFPVQGIEGEVEKCGDYAGPNCTNSNLVFQILIKLIPPPKTELFKFGFKCACVAGEGAAGQPQIEVSWNGGRFASKSKGANGEWNEYMSLSESGSNQDVRIEVYDWDSGLNDLMGVLTLKENDMFELTPGEWTEFKVQGIENEVEKCGVYAGPNCSNSNLEFTLMIKLARPAKYRLTLYNWCICADGEKTDGYAVVNVIYKDGQESEIGKTEIVEDNYYGSWKTTFILLSEPGGGEKLNVVVWDNDDISRNDKLGSVTVAYEDLISRKGKANVFELVRNGNEVEKCPKSQGTNVDSICDGKFPPQLKLALWHME